MNETTRQPVCECMLLSVLLYFFNINNLVVHSMNVRYYYHKNNNSNNKDKNLSKLFYKIKN